MLPALLGLAAVALVVVFWLPGSIDQEDPQDVGDVARGHPGGIDFLCDRLTVGREDRFQLILTISQLLSRRGIGMLTNHATR